MKRVTCYMRFICTARSSGYFRCKERFDALLLRQGGVHIDRTSKEPVRPRVELIF